MEFHLVDVKSRTRHARQLPCVVGRGDDAGFRVRNDSVSRRHCVFALVDGIVTVTDTGSTNGTFLDGRKLAPEAVTPVANGTDLRIGGIVLRVEYAAAPAVSQADTVPLPAHADPVDAALDAPASEAPHAVETETADAVGPGAAPNTAADGEAAPVTADGSPVLANLAAADPADLPAFPEATAPPPDEGSFDFLGGGAAAPPAAADDLDDFFKSLS